MFSHSVTSDSLQAHDCSTPGIPVLHYLPKFAQTHVHWVDDAILPSHPLLPLLLLPSTFPESGSFPMSWFFTSGGQSIWKVKINKEKLTIASVNKVKANNTLIYCWRECKMVWPLWKIVWQLSLFLLEYSCFTIVLASVVQQSESVIHIYLSPLFWISFPFRSPQAISLKQTP